VLALRATDSDLGEPSQHSEDDPEENNLLDAVREHPVAFAWSIYAIFVMVTSAYTNSISNSVLGIPQFRKDFGHQFQGNYVLPASWQAAYYGATNAA
jgi:SP family general alpha glucoside:H+ symporter-like MFS transporter